MVVSFYFNGMENYQYNPYYTFQFEKNAPGSTTASKIDKIRLNPLIHHIGKSSISPVLYSTSNLLCILCFETEYCFLSSKGDYAHFHFSKMHLHRSLVKSVSAARISTL